MPIPETLAHYRLLGPLGKGGMGEVYAAEDTRLHRKVAIKVLPAVLAHDPERRNRFEREAHAVASLNHPNIVTIHSVEEEEGVPFLTMELVEGKPLSEIVRGGALPLDMLLRVGMAVADAMAAAHQRGITHRDLKPGNIMVTPEGRVKVLDFGLAKLREAQVDAMADEVTRPPVEDLTGEGRILGTVAYMSPEQAEGKPVDGRSDIFALGVVLHELATGEKPFKGDTNVSLISSILKDTPPPVTEINPSLPAGLARVVRRSLAKDPSRRYQTATDLRNDLEELKDEVDSGVRSGVTAVRAPAQPARRRVNVVGIATILLLAVAAFGAVYSYWQSRAPRTESEFLTIDRPSQLTSTGNAALAAISPDGRYVAHVKNEPGAPSLWMRQTATTSDVEIVKGAPLRYAGVSWAPDGNHVFYVTYEITGGIGTLYRIPALGGTPQKILEDVDTRISFSPDASQFTFVRGYPAEGTAWLMLANADGTNVRQLAELEKPDQLALNGPAWSSDGKTIVAPARSLRDGPHMLIVGIDAASGAVTRLEGRWAAVLDIEWVRGTQTFIASVAELTAAPPQLWQFTYPEGERRRLTNDLNTYSSVSLSADASTLTTVQTEAVSNLFVAPIDNPNSALQITRGRGRADGQTGLDWAPDGQIVFVSGASGRQQVWITDRGGKNVRQLTASPQEPVFKVSVTPDGQYITFQRLSDGQMRIWRMRLDGSEQRMITRGELDQAPVAAPNGVVYFHRIVNGAPRTFKVPIEGGDAVQVSEHHFRPIDVSPDGSRLLGVSWNPKAQRSALAIMPAAADAPPQLLAGLSTFSGGFTHDGAGIIFPVVGRGTVQVVRADLESRKVETLGSVSDFVFNGALSPDGKELVLSRGGVLSDVLLLTLARQ